jgi:hypothetical protein
VSYKNYLNKKLMNEDEESTTYAYLAARFLSKLDDVIKHGLPEVFDDMRGFVINGITELPWEVSKFKKSVEWIKSQEKWLEMVEEIKHNFDFNIDKFLELKLASMEDKLNG